MINFFDKKNEEITIYCDNRELRSKVHPILKKRCKVREINLDVGDYLLSKNVAVERKSASDFVRSIIDGRLFQQAVKMRESFENPVMIIEGENIFDTNIKIHPNAIRGAIASIAIGFSLPIIWTKNSLETAEMIFSIAKREQIHLKKNVSIRNMKKKKSMNQIQEYLVAGLPKINSITAKKLLKHFETPKNLFNAAKEDLKQIDGIGDELSEKILRVLNSKYENSILEG